MNNRKEVRVGIRKELLDDFITDYGNSKNALYPGEAVEVLDVEVDGDLAMVHAEIYERTLN